jgi:hypothetical protein
MKTMLMLLRFFVVASLPVPGSEGADNLEIADLSSTLRLDLTASPSNVVGGRDIILTAKLTNTGKTPVVVLPANMLARVGHGIEPRCHNQLGMFGSAIAEGGAPPTEVELARIEPGKSVMQARTIVAPKIHECVAGGSVIIGAEYCMFSEMSVQGLQGVKGCVKSNKVAVVIEPTTGAP